MDTTRQSQPAGESEVIETGRTNPASCFDTALDLMDAAVIRKCEAIIADITERTRSFPEEHLEYGYWHVHLDRSSAFLNSPDVPDGARRLCAQTLIDRAQHLVDLNADSQNLTRVVALMNFPRLSESQIIVFF